MLGLAVKRPADTSHPPSGKRRCIPWASSPLLEASPAVKVNENSSLRERAEPFRLVTAQFPIDALTAVWKDGTNRPINVAHQRRLCKLFQKQGLHRNDASHRLRLACSKTDVEAMMNLLWRRQEVDSPWLKKNIEGPWPSFMDWKDVNRRDAELMAGNHRVEALKEFLKLPGNQEQGRWWICDVYNQGG